MKVGWSGKRTASKPSSSARRPDSSRCRLRSVGVSVVASSSAKPTVLARTVTQVDGAVTPSIGVSKWGALYREPGDEISGACQLHEAVGHPAETVHARG